ncbi:hypothetical protein CANTEDRAFT_114835, partial [Yamadazyma tenuis ATCC 10573]
MTIQRLQTDIDVLFRVRAAVEEVVKKKSGGGTTRLWRRKCRYTIELVTGVWSECMGPFKKQTVVPGTRQTQRGFSSIMLSTHFSSKAVA